jgi:hypothetical protein
VLNFATNARGFFNMPNQGATSGEWSRAFAFVAGDEGDDATGLRRACSKPASVPQLAASVSSRYSILGPGSVVGELSMIDGGPRSASVTALRDSKLSSSAAPRSRRSDKPGLTSTVISRHCWHSGCAIPTKPLWPRISCR